MKPRLAVAVLALVLVVSLVVGTVFHQAHLLSPRSVGVSLQAVGDGDGGVIVIWRDGAGIWAQRVGPHGACLWDRGVRISAEDSSTGRFTLLLSLIHI